MKKTTLFLLLVILITLSFGQNYRNNESIFKYGFKAGFNTPFVKDYSVVPGNWTFSGEVGFFGRIGKKYSVDIGVDVNFNKLYFNSDSPFLSSMIETKFLQIPLRFLIEFPTYKFQKLQLSTGLLYQQLINVSINNIGYSQKNITKQQFIYTVGVGYSYKFVTIELNYRHFLKNFDVETTKKKQKHLNISIYVAF